jgi:hypothetical protein
MGKKYCFHKAQLQFKQHCETAIYMCIKCSTCNHSSWQEKTNQIWITNERLQCENSSLSIFTDVSLSYLKTYFGLGSDCCIVACTQQCITSFYGLTHHHEMTWQHIFQQATLLGNRYLPHLLHNTLVICQLILQNKFLDMAIYINFQVMYWHVHHILHSKLLICCGDAKVICHL